MMKLSLLWSVLGCAALLVGVVAFPEDPEWDEQALEAFPVSPREQRNVWDHMEMLGRVTQLARIDGLVHMHHATHASVQDCYMYG